MTSEKICLTARHAVSNIQQQLVDDSAIQMMISGLICAEETYFPEKSIYEAVSHFEDCTECQHWADAFLDKLFPDRITHRERMQQYCCAYMFEAVTDPAAQTRFSFERFRNEDPCWRINEEYVFTQFCPWCGQKLPDHAFEAV